MIFRYKIIYLLKLKKNVKPASDKESIKIETRQIFVYNTIINIFTSKVYLSRSLSLAPFTRPFC